MSTQPKILQDRQVEFRVRLPADLAREMEQLLTERGIEFSTLVRIALKKINNAPATYDLEDVLRHGKYFGERIETVIRADPGYIRWCQRTVEGFVLTERAAGLLEQIK